MGGFEGGDEGGFWDIDIQPSLIHQQNSSKTTDKSASYIEKNDVGYSIKAHAKITLFLKITGFKDGYHTLRSRVIRVPELYDTISFVPCSCDSFTIEGCDDIPAKSNTIYKAYNALINFTGDSDIVEFFHEHKVVVTKRITSASGLGGSSSDAAAFIHMVKEVCNLVLSIDELVNIASSIGHDVVFFIYNYTSANVSGFGEIVEPFEEEALNVQLYTPNIKYDTTVLYRTFHEHLLGSVSLSSFSNWETMDSKSILKHILDPAKLNDLYAATLIAYPEVKKETNEGWFYSGTGATFFKLLT